MNKGKLYLIPTILAKDTEEKTLPPSILETIRKTNIFIVENTRTCRRFIKKICREKDINSTTFYSYGKNDTLDLKKDFLSHILLGKDIGLLSEAGTPCVADPGSEIVTYAHKFEVSVIPLVGPSSILLALMASGMNGQNFSFVGYLPIERSKRIKKIKELESITQKTKQTQIFIETPYRNNILIKTLLEICNNKTKLCIASNITLTNEYIKTRAIKEWKLEKIDLHKKPAIFLIG